jgi:hypothetical protein
MKTKQIGENVTDTIDDSVSLVDFSPESYIVDKTLEKSVDAEYNLYTGIKSNNTEMTEEILAKKYKTGMLAGLFSALIFMSVFFATEEILISAVSAISFYGIYALVFGTIVLKPGVAKYGLITDIKARIAGVIFIGLAIFILLNVQN